MSGPDDPGLAGKVAVVTGGGAADDGIGNGRAAAILLARAGRTCSWWTASSKPRAFEADVTQDAGCAAMVGRALERWGRLDVLDNNVGIGSRGSVVDESEERWEQVMRTNVGSMFLASKHAIPAMVRGGKGGAIVNVSSISALRPRGLTAYSASKGAVIALTRAMTVDHAADGIRVNCVAPGPV